MFNPFFYRSEFDIQQNYSLTKDTFLSVLIYLIVLLTAGSVFAQDKEGATFSYLQDDFNKIQQAWSDPVIPHIFVVAHRANSTIRNGVPNVPENSLEAMEIAIRHGVDVIEVDLKKTSDGHFVIMHDETLNRTSTGFGAVSDQTLEEIRDLNLVYEGTITDIKIPTLEETLELVRGRAMINLDHVDPILESVLNIVEEMDMLDHAIVKSRDNPDKILTRLEDFPMNEVLYMPIISAHDHEKDELLGLIEDYRDKIGITTVELIFNNDSRHLMTNELFSEIQNIGVRVWINTLWDGRLSGGLGDDHIPDQSDKVWGDLIKKGVSVIQTDNAAYMRAYITSYHFMNRLQESTQ